MTLTASFSTPSCPYASLAAEIKRVVVEEAGATVRLPVVVKEEPAKSVLPT